VNARLLIGMMAIVVALAACGGDDATGEDGTIEGTDVVVEMYDNRYQYTEIRIPVGGSVDWVGAGRNPHNAVDAEEAWSTEDAFGSLEQYEDEAAKLVYNTPGRYTFFCTFHGNAQGAGMAGVLVVGDA